MILIKKHLIFSLLAATIVLLFVPTVRATAESFTVRAGQEEIRSFSLAADDHVQVRFTVTAQGVSVLDFYITDPRGNIMANFGTTGNVNYAFVCSQEGEYKLHFSNVVSAEDKLVSLDYEVQHYVFGMQQNLFLTLIVVGICVAAIAVFILMSKHP
jgi:multisubunit Na+/H+ antiporter MnhC subunit